MGLRKIGKGPLQPLGVTAGHPLCCPSPYAMSAARVPVGDWGARSFPPVAPGLHRHCPRHLQTWKRNASHTFSQDSDLGRPCLSFPLGPQVACWRPWSLCTGVGAPGDWLAALQL